MGKRGRKPSSEPKGYFYEREEKAVVDYLASNDEVEKNEIYNTIIKPAFTQMIESIIRRYKLYIPDEDFDQTFSDTISFLLTKLNCFKSEKKYKAYSYCGTICKNYLIYKVNQFNKKQGRILPYEDVASEFNNSIKFSSAAEENTLFVKELMTKTIEKVNDILDGKANVTLTQNERKVGEALKSLLENWEEVLPAEGSAKLNKSAVLLFLRDSTNLTTKELRDNMKKFKLGYYNTKKQMLQ